MGKNKVILLWLLLPFVIFVKYGCFDLPKDIVMPKWDVSLNVPIVNKGYTLWDAIKKDTSKLNYYKGSANTGLLYYSDIHRIDPVTVGDNLNINSFSTATSVAIGALDISPITSSILPPDISPALIYNTPMIFPAITATTVTKDFTQSTESNLITIQSGVLHFKVTNNFPVPMVISRLVIKNKNSSDIVVDTDGFALNSGQSVEKDYSLTGKTVNKDLVVEATLFTTGSGTTNVILSPSTNLAFNAQVQDLVLSNVSAILDQNTFNINSSYEFDDSTYVQNAVIEEGALTITVNSNIDIGLIATLTIQNLKNGAGNTYSQIINLARKEKNKIISVPSLKGYTLTDPQGGLINRIQYSITVSSVVDNQISIISSTDAVSANLDISNLYFRSFTGKIKPTNLTVNETTIDLSIGDVQDNLLVSQIDFENPKIELKLRKSSSVQLGFSGQLVGRSSTHSAQLNIPYTPIGTNETTIVLNSSDVRTFIKSFSGKLPKTISVKGKGVVNPDYATGTINSTDSVYGTANLEFPMKVGILGGSFRDSSSVDIDQDIRDEMKKVKDGNLVLEIENGIAFDAGFSARLYDENNVFMMNLPPNRSPNDTLVHISAATVNSLGKVTAPSQSHITFSLNSEEITKLTQAKYLISKITFYTTGNTGAPVEFKSTDAIKIKAYGSLNYTVEDKK